MVYSRRVVKRRPASLTPEEWDNIVAGRIKWPPAGDAGSAEPDDLPADRTILCWWCREYHRASEVKGCMGLPMKKATQGNSTSSTSSVLVPGLLAAFSEIWAFLTATSYPDGSKRRTGRLSLSCESGQLKLSLSDDETAQYICLSSTSLDDALLAAEVGMAEGTLSWRESKYQGQGGKKRP